MSSILKEQEINRFLSDIEHTFPNFVAGIICDKHGFPLGSKIPKGFHIDENTMALSSITNNRDFINDNRFVKVNRALDKSENVRLFLLLDKTNQYINRFKELNKIIQTQNLF